MESISSIKKPYYILYYIYWKHWKKLESSLTEQIYMYNSQQRMKAHIPQRLSACHCKYKKTVWLCMTKQYKPNA